jgi:sulfotransferase family protein
VNNNDDFRPVFIVGNPRSGTTSLATLMSRHSKIAIPSETQFLCKVLPCGISLPRKSASHKVLAEAMFSYYRMTDLELDQASFLEYFKQYTPTYKNLFRATLEFYTISQNKVIAGEKSPIHIFYVPLILKWFPNAKIICIVRDGRDVVQSLMKVPWGHNNLLRYCADWSYSSRLIRGYLNHYPESVHLVKFDSLLVDAEATLLSICEFIGEKFEAVQLSVSDDSKVVADWESEWKSKATTKLDSTRLGVWRNNVSPLDNYIMNKIMYKWIVYWGYESSYGDVFALKIKIVGYVKSLFYRGGMYVAWYNGRDVLKKIVCYLGIMKIYKEPVR